MVFHTMGKETTLMPTGWPAFVPTVTSTVPLDVSTEGSVMTEPSDDGGHEDDDAAEDEDRRSDATTAPPMLQEAAVVIALDDSIALPPPLTEMNYPVLDKIPGMA